jgi:hypothetical protein
MIPKISKERIEDILGKNISAHEIILKKLNYPANRESLKFVIVCIMQRDFVTTGDIKKKFGCEQSWASKLLHRYVQLGLLKNTNITGSNMTEFYPALDSQTKEPLIYKYFGIIEKIEKRETIK